MFRDRRPILPMHLSIKRRPIHRYILGPCVHVEVFAAARGAQVTRVVPMETGNEMLRNGAAQVRTLAVGLLDIVWLERVAKIHYKRVYQILVEIKGIFEAQYPSCTLTSNDALYTSINCAYGGFT